MTDARFAWSRLSKQQLGWHAETFVQSQLMMHGFRVFVPVVDDFGVDCVAQRPGAPFIEIQVKCVRGFSYVFMHKARFVLRDGLYVALVLLTEGAPEEWYLIPARTWEHPDSLFVSRDYVDRKSPPEWLGLCAKNMPSLAAYRAASMLERLP